MTKGRLEAFSDGVIAIIITIMVLELKAPHHPTLGDLRPLVPAILSYVVSFTYVGIYWNNHHHLLHAAKRISGMTLWANLHLLFWLSLIPFVTSWAGETGFAPWPVATYGVVMLLAGVAWDILRRVLIACQDPGSALPVAFRRNAKEYVSIALYAGAVGVALVGDWGRWLACGLYCAVACVWFVPDRRIERALSAHPE